MAHDSAAKAHEAAAEAVADADAELKAALRPLEEEAASKRVRQGATARARRG